MIFKTHVVGAERIPAQFKLLNQQTQERLAATCKEQANQVQSKTKSVWESVLNKRTGKTLRSFKVYAYNKDGKVGAVVKSAWYIARFWEFGFGGGKRFLVKGHIRKSSASEKNLASGKTKVRIVKDDKYRTSKKRTRIKTIIVSQAEMFVKPHYRLIDQKARPSLLPAFNSQRTEIREAMARAIKRVS